MEVVAFMLTVPAPPVDGQWDRRRVLSTTTSQHGDGANTIITPDDLKDDNAEALITELCRWASSRPIPFNFDENLERPPGSNNNRLVKSTTLVGYVGKVIKYFRSVDPTHPDWKDLKSMEEVPDWWTALRPLFQKEAKSFEFLYDGDGVFGTNEIKPLYQEIPPLPKIPGLAESIEDEPLRSMDQKHIFLSLVKKANDTNNNLQKLAIIHALADAIGRGGEAKFQSFRDWVFDYLWMVTNTPWKEKKTVNMYALPRVPDKRWYFDWYVIMAMYSMCEKGLYRSPSEVERGLGLVVFPLLHRMNDNNVASFVTDTLRGTPPNLQSYISSKSLRQAGCAELARHHAITLLQIIARTGHWLNMTLDSYLPPDDVARGIPAANALHGEKNLKTPVVIPRLEALGVAMPSALQLMEEMFCISIEQFQKGGDLHILVKTFAASLLMHHRQIVIDCGRTNIVSDTLLVKAEKVRITCSDSPQLPVNLVLEEWSKKIEQDFERRSKEARLSVMDEPGRESCAMIASLAAEVRMVSETVAGMKRTVDAVVVENANKTATISVLQKDNLKLRQELSLVHSREALRAQSMTSTPDGGLSKRQRTGTNSEEDATHIDFNADAVEVALPPAVAAPPASAPAAPVVAPPASAPAAPVAAPPAMAAAAQPAAAAAEAAATRTGIPIRYSHQADQRSKKGTVKNKPFSSVLKNMATRGLFKRVSKLKSGQCS